MEYKLYNGDCFEKLKELPDNSIDSIVTDPPYGLSKDPVMTDVLEAWMNGLEYKHGHKGFMGKEWDSFVPGPNVWKECMRVLKPGGHIVAFFGTRTYDLGVLAIRMAGFEVRDQLAWVFGSGFPKSMDVSKAIDKAAGAEREVVGQKLTGGITRPSTATKSSDQYDEKHTHGYSSGQNLVPVTAPATDAAKQWEGWGTALKPAYEPIVLARKPLIGTVAQNVLEHGTGAINIDESRVVASAEDIEEMSGRSGKSTDNKIYGNGIGQDGVWEVNTKGRFPANLIHDGSEEVVEQFPYTKSGTITPEQQKNGGFAGSGAGIIYGSAERGGVNGFEGNEGSAARFFYCAKASKSDRDEGLESFQEKQASGLPLRSKDMESNGEGLDGTKTFRETTRKNVHPTVKPTDLMRYLCRLITPPNGTILDPFMGSGSTGKAAMYEGFNFIGIEMDPQYVAISEARIKFAIVDKTNNPNKKVVKSKKVEYNASNADENLGKFFE